MTPPTTNPKFPVITVSVRSGYFGDPTPMRLHVEDLVAQGLTDGVKEVFEENGQITIYRKWLDIDTANSWIQFIKETFPTDTDRITLEIYS